MSKGAQRIAETVLFVLVFELKTLLPKEE